jgi:hypothetical protein
MCYRIVKTTEGYSTLKVEKGTYGSFPTLKEAKEAIKVIETEVMEIGAYAILPDKNKKKSKEDKAKNNKKVTRDYRLK